MTLSLDFKGELDTFDTASMLRCSCRNYKLASDTRSCTSLSRSTQERTNCLLRGWRPWCIVLTCCNHGPSWAHGNLADFFPGDSWPEAWLKHDLMDTGSVPPHSCGSSKGHSEQVRRVSFAALVEGSYMPCSEYGHERRMSATYLGTFCTLESLDLGSLTIPSCSVRSWAFSCYLAF